MNGTVLFTDYTNSKNSGLGTVVTSNISDIWKFVLYDNSILPATYNFNEPYMENITHQIVTTNNANQFSQIWLMNVSNATYGWFEIMMNSTQTANPIQIWYCNSSYSTGSLINNNCMQFAGLIANSTFNHVHTVNTAHQVFSFSVNESTGKIGTVYVTPNSYFIVGGAKDWNIYDIVNTSRTGAIKTTTNRGISWTNQTYTIDAHLHQFNLNTTFHYYACANEDRKSVV